MKKTVLITGANGFIGSRLAKKLEELRNKVITINHQLLTKPKILRKLINDVRPEVIYHLAAYGNHYGQNEPGKIFRSNLVGTFNLLHASRDIGLKAFINTGSSSEYGRQTSPMKEELLPAAETFYGATKVGTTYLARAYARELKLPIVTVRPFSVYGPGEAPHRFIPTIIECSLTGKELLLTPGVHDWIFIDDFIEGIITVSANANLLAGEVVNIGSGKQYTNEKIVRVVENILELKIQVRRSKKLRLYDTVQMWKSDITKLQRLGWKQNYDLIAGITKTINEIRTN